MRISLGKGGTSVSDMTPSQKFFMAVLFLLIGSAALGYGYMNYSAQGDAINDAVSVNGTVVDTEIETHSGRRSTDYEPVVRFDYMYGGQSYQSNNMYPAGVSDYLDTRSEAELVLDNYRESSEVSAYLDPDNPGEAFLKQQRSNHPLVFMGIGVFMIIAAGYLFVHRFLLG